MTTSELVYPVILFDEKGYFFVAVDEESLTTMRSSAFKHNRYEGYVIVDCKGRPFKIKHTRFVSSKGIFWGYTVFFDRIIRVEHLLDDEPLDWSFEDAKAKVLRDMKRALHSMDPDYWLGEMRKVKEAQSLREIIEVILPQYDIRPYLKRGSRWK